MYSGSVAGAGTNWATGNARWFVRPSLARAVPDTVTYHWLRTVMAVATAVVAAWIAFLATGNRAAWWAVLASLPVFAGAYLVLFLMNLGGWNRRWTASWSLVSAGGLHLMLRLEPKDPTVKFSGPEVSCWVRSPSGETFKNRTPSASGQGQHYAQYPELFDQAPPLTPGRYRVTWVEETRPGKWREILTHRVTVGRR
jgi:hypothetical protein